MERFVCGILTFTIVCLTIFVAGCGDKDGQSVESGLLPGGFTALSPDGEYAIVDGMRDTGHGMQDVTQVVRVKNYRALGFEVVFELPDDAADAGFCGDHRVSYVQPDGESVRLSVFDPASGESPVMVAAVAGGGRIRYHAAESLIVIQVPKGQHVSRVLPDGSVDEVAVLPPSVFGSFSNDGSKYNYIVNVSVPERNSKVWDVRLESYDVRGDTRDTLFVGQSCFGAVTGGDNGNPVYFQSSMPTFEATNVWQYDPATGDLTQRTFLTPPLFVSTFHLVRDSLVCLVKDPSRLAGQQYRYETYSR